MHVWSTVGTDPSSCLMPKAAASERITLKKKKQTLLQYVGYVGLNFHKLTLARTKPAPLFPLLAAFWIKHC